MGSEYDENLEENPFFQQVRTNYGEILRTASENNWIICIPRCGAFSSIHLTKTDILEHILTPTGDNQHYQNLNHVEIEKVNNILIFKLANISRRTRVLFKEDFFVEKHKYTVWCIDEVLNRNEVLRGTELIEINSFCDCINFLWTDALGCKLLEEINYVVQSSLQQCKIEEFDLLQLKNFMQNTYDQCLFKALECFQDKLEDENFLQNLKLSVETFMYACIKDKSFNTLCTITSNSDANLNKIIRNSQDIPLRAFQINHEFYDLLPLAKLELNKINNTCTVLNKILCLQRTFRVLSRGSLSSEVFLQIFIFLMIKSNVYNWTANLLFITTFRFCDVKISDESNFLITTFQAALKYLSEGDLKRLEVKTDVETCQNDFYKLVSLIQQGNLESLINAITYNDKLSKKLCHPLCSCDNCEYLLKTNTCQIDSRDEKGRSLLHVASKINHPDIVQFLIVKGANVNVSDYSGLSPIHYAVSAGNQQATFLLLHAGCEKNARDSEGNSPLHIATRNGQESCVKTLIYFTEEHGNDLDINCVNNSGDTPLHFASKYGYIGLVKLLVEYGAKIVLNNRSMSPYNMAHNDFIKNILESVAVLRREIASIKFASRSDAGDGFFETKKSKSYRRKPENIKMTSADFGVSPKNLEQHKKTELLLKAIENNDLPLTCFYLGIPMPHASSVKQTNCHPLCICDKCQETIEEDPVISEDYKQALNINVCNQDGWTPLHVAAKFGRIDILRLLLDAGALVNAKSHHTLYTPMHLACMHRKKHVVKELLKCGNCRTDPTDAYGNTPLHYACSNNDLVIFDVLMSHGADASVKNNAGRTVWDEAEENVFPNITKALKERGNYKRLNLDEFVII